MDPKSAFNASVCIIGIAILLIHVVNLLLKRGRRKDENSLLIFILFTILHFSLYLTFTLVKANYTSDTLIFSAYTTFFIMNNIEVLLLFLYTISFVSYKKKTIEIIALINIGIFFIYTILDIVNIFNHMFFYAENGIYVRSKMMLFSQGYQFIAFSIILFLTLLDKKLGISQKIAFLVYCVLPIIAIILQNMLPGYAIAYLSIIISIEILFLFVNMKKNMMLAQEEKKTKEAEIKLMMSQIRPHFIYNTLASISTLIKIDPDKAQQGLDEFTEYLRANFSSLSETGLVPFKDELRHIETYLSLEKMRFDERLNVIYDIQCKDFDIPPLCIQPLVENAVKHGILQNIEGGTITIRSYEKEAGFVVEIIDNGVGFDVNDPKLKENKHIGLANIRYRLSTMCKGELNIESEIDKGTTAVVTFYR